VKINIQKTRIVVFNRAGKLSKNGKWRLGTEEMEVTINMKYLGIILGGKGKM
jgi:hypothetical protein